MGREHNVSLFKGYSTYWSFILHFPSFCSSFLISGTHKNSESIFLKALKVFHSPPPLLHRLCCLSSNNNCVLHEIIYFFPEITLVSNARCKDFEIIYPQFWLKTKEDNCMGKPLPTARGNDRGVIIMEVAAAVTEIFLPVTSQNAAHRWIHLGLELCFSSLSSLSFAGHTQSNFCLVISLFFPLSKY